MTTSQQPQSRPQHPLSPQQAYGHAAPGRPAHDRAAYPQQNDGQTYGQPPAGRHGQAPQQSFDRPYGQQPSGQQVFGQQVFGRQAAGPQTSGRAHPQPSGRSGPNRVPGHTGPQQVPGRDGSPLGDDRSGYPQAYGRPATQTYAPAPPHAQDAREIPSQPGRQPYPAAATGRAPKNGFGTTALVLGIIGALFAFIPVIGMIAWPLVILGLIFGILGIARAGSGKADNRGVAISGTVLSAIGLIICIVWASALSAAVSSSTPAGTPGSAAPAASAGAGDSTAPAAFPGATSNDVTGKAGDTLTVGDMQIQATAMEPGDSVLGQTLCSTVTYTNTGSTTAFFNGGFDWKLQDPAGAAVMSSLLGADRLLSAGQLAPGGTTSGTVCFDRPSGASGQYVLLYDAMTFSSTRGAWLNKVG